MEKAEAKTLREALGLTYREAAKLGGIGDRTIRYMESPTSDYAVQEDYAEMLRQRAAFNSAKAKEEAVNIAAAGIKCFAIVRPLGDEDISEYTDAWPSAQSYAVYLLALKDELNNLGIEASITYS